MTQYDLSSRDEVIKVVSTAFRSLNHSEELTRSAIESLTLWLTDDEYAEYKPQLIHLISQDDWDYLFDCFYTIIPFGTGGRRGEVGIGPNRINIWTIRSSAQGHAEYLLKKYGNEACKRGVVFAHDVRKFLGNKHFDQTILNPVMNLDGVALERAAAEVYAGNNIPIHIFRDIRTTPELSFAIRYLHALAGVNFSASHNPPDHNGKKVFDERGGQLIPPYDQELVDLVSQVKSVKSLHYEDAVKKGLILYISSDVDDAYVSQVTSLTLNSARDINVVYTPLHGCGLTSVKRVLEDSGFKLFIDPKTSNPSPRFENITFNIPNPEVVESFDTSIIYADSVSADIILNSDPDADRIGVMARHNNEWRVVNGNEIGIILTEYAIKNRGRTEETPVVITTRVTSNLIHEICEENNVKCIFDLLVGYKYIADQINALEDAGHEKRFLFSCEESNGYLAGTYARDKDAAIAALWLSELAASLKKKGQTLIDYLDQIYSTYSYYNNYLTEIRMLGAAGFRNIHLIQDSLRKNPPQSFDGFIVESFEDWRNRLPIVSNTDNSSKDVLVFSFEPFDKIKTCRVTIRPSGTEPKIKFYFELSSDSRSHSSLDEAKKYVAEQTTKLERAVMNYCYHSIGVDFPERGYLLFWQLPLSDKLRYFEIEETLHALQDEPSDLRYKEALTLLSFLGSNPIEKVTRAFEERYSIGLLDFLNS